MQAICEDICIYFRLDVNHNSNPDPNFIKHILLKNGHNSQNYRIITEKTLIAEFVFTYLHNYMIQ